MYRNKMCLFLMLMYDSNSIATIHESPMDKFDGPPWVDSQEVQFFSFSPRRVSVIIWLCVWAQTAEEIDIFVLSRQVMGIQIDRCTV